MDEGMNNTVLHHSSPRIHRFVSPLIFHPLSLAWLASNDLFGGARDSIIRQSIGVFVSD